MGAILDKNEIQWSDFTATQSMPLEHGSNDYLLYLIPRDADGNAVKEGVVGKIDVNVRPWLAPFFEPLDAVAEKNTSPIDISSNHVVPMKGLPLAELQISQNSAISGCDYIDIQVSHLV